MHIEEMIEQCISDSSRWFPDLSPDLPLLVLCMCGEAGEVANLVKKVARGTHTFDETMRERTLEELVDTLIYLCNVVGTIDSFGTDFLRVWNEKRTANEIRYGDTSKLPHGDQSGPNMIREAIRQARGGDAPVQIQGYA